MRPPRALRANLPTTVFVAAVAVVAPLLVPAAQGTARASAEITDVATAFDKGNPFDFRLRVGYDFSYKTAAVKREAEEPGFTQIQTFKDLVYTESRHTFWMRAEISIFQDLELTLGLPLVLADYQQLGYDQRLGNGCVYSGKDANCVDAGNSTTTNSAGAPVAPADDPTQYIVPPGGYDAQNSMDGAPVGFPSGSALVFRGPKRGGSGKDLLDTINLGLNWDALSQARDPSKPTWQVGVEYKFSIGNIMQFDRSRPDANYGVADGLDHFLVHTSVSRRFKYIEPYASFWYDLPIVRRSDTLFFDLGPNAKNSGPQMSAGTVFGIEGVPYEDKANQYKIAIDANAAISAHFDGRGYSEIWQMLATSPALGCASSGDATVDGRDAMWNPACAPGQTNNYQGRAYTGVTTIENYASVGGSIGLTVQAGKYVRFHAAYTYQRDQAHIVTMDDVGKPAGGDTRVQNASEFNPAYRPIINSVGRRYLVDEADTHTATVWAQLMF